jgi:hypothetical protein
LKKNIIMVLLFVVVLGGTLLAAEMTTAKVKVATANVRSKPDASAAIVAKVTMGTVLEVTGREGAWYEVNVNDPSGKKISGYISNTVVEVSGEDEEETTVKPRAVRRAAPRAKARREIAGGGIKLMGGLSMDNLNLSEALPPEAKKTAKIGFMGGLGYESGGMIAFEMDLLYRPGGAVLKAVARHDPISSGRGRGRLSSEPESRGHGNGRHHHGRRRNRPCQPDRIWPGFRRRCRAAGRGHEPASGSPLPPWPVKSDQGCRSGRLHETDGVDDHSGRQVLSSRYGQGTYVVCDPCRRSAGTISAPMINRRSRTFPATG